MLEVAINVADKLNG